MRPLELTPATPEHGFFFVFFFIELIKILVQLAWHGFVQFELYYIYVVRVERGVLCILYLTSRFLGPTIPALPPPSPHCKTRGSYHPHLDHHEFYVIFWRHKTTPSPPKWKKINPKGHPSYTLRLPKRKAEKEKLEETILVYGSPCQSVGLSQC